MKIEKYWTTLIKEIVIIIKTIWISICRVKQGIKQIPDCNFNRGNFNNTQIFPHLIKTMNWVNMFRPVCIQYKIALLIQITITWIYRIKNLENRDNNQKINKILRFYKNNFN